MTSTRRHPSSRHRRSAGSALLAATLVLAVSCGDGSQTSGTATTRPSQNRPDPSATTGITGGPVKVTGTVVGHFEKPIVLLPRPGHDGELWLAEQGGTVRRVTQADDGTLTGGDVLLDLTDQTQADGEQGLLGMTFARDGAALVVSYTDLQGTSHIEAYDVAGDSVDTGSRRELLRQDQPFRNHNGGNVVVGPDGKLWFGFGDGGAGDDPENRAQDPTTLLGKIIRFDLDGGDPEIVISGVRNPWRFAFDNDGSLWIADVGQDHIEEVDHLQPNQIDGANLGWSGYEGREPYLDGDGRRPADAIAPVFQYTHEEGGCSITGGFAYRGPTLTGLDGAFLFADYCAGRVRAVVLDDGATDGRGLDLGIDVEAPMSFGTDAQGEAYVLSGNGDVVKLTPA